MIGQDMSGFLEPEGRELVKNSSFVRDAAGQDNVKGRDAVGGHDEKFITCTINVSDLAPPK
jgi:hypothetical protein